MKERPILFSGPMVRAILEGRKTQTRRVIKLQDGGHVVERDRSRRRWHPDDPDAVLACPYGQPGDRLWVRETWWHDEPFHMSDCASCFYAADYPPDWHPDPEQDGVMVNYVKRPSIHMPRHHSRLALEVVSRRLERLQAISDSDAVDEGVEYRNGYFNGGSHPTKGTPKCFPDAPSAFADIWDTINAARGFGWSVNPWVWAVEFKVVTPDALRASAPSASSAVNR